MDSRPLVGAGKVEDTFNLLGHAARKIAECAAATTGLSFEGVCHLSHATLLLAPSVKAGLDVDWSDPIEKGNALQTLVVQVRSLSEWVGRIMGGSGLDGPITKYIEALQQVQEQNLDEVNGRISMHQGVAADRRVSIEDMRHGRKSKSQRLNGYKEHIASDLDNGVILACAVTPANVPEEEAAPLLKADIEVQGFKVVELSIDRGYLNSSIVDDIEDAGGEVLCKPWPTQNAKGLFTKRDFTVNARQGTITCPAGEVEQFEPTSPRTRAASSAYASCARHRRGACAFDDGHRWSTTSRTSRRARGYRGARKNAFHLRRASAVRNLEVTQRLLAS